MCGESEAQWDSYELHSIEHIIICVTTQQLSIQHCKVQFSSSDFDKSFFGSSSPSHSRCALIVKFISRICHVGVFLSQNNKKVLWIVVDRESISPNLYLSIFMPYHHMRNAMQHFMHRYFEAAALCKLWIAAASEFWQFARRRGAVAHFLILRSEGQI